MNTSILKTRCATLVLLLTVTLCGASCLKTGSAMIPKSPQSVYINDTPVPLSERPSIIPNRILSKSVNSTRYFDVNLSKDVQKYIFELCGKKNIDPATVIAMIERESNYDETAIGDNGDSLGLMQIQPRWNRERMEKLNCHDLLDPYQNVTVGVDYLSELLSYDNSLEWVLMAYNGGYAYANEKMNEGIVSDYALTILSTSEKLRIAFEHM